MAKVKSVKINRNKGKHRDIVDKRGSVGNSENYINIKTTTGDLVVKEGDVYEK